MVDELGQGIVVRGVQWREAFPFTHLFRGFRVAIHPSKLVLGLVLLLLLYTGGRILDGIWNERDSAIPNETELYESAWENNETRSAFAHMRRTERLALEQRYAADLVAAKIYPNSQSARDAAVDGDGLGKLKEHIVERRDAAHVEIDKRLQSLPTPSLEDYP